MSGSWGGSVNGVSYSFCIDRNLTPIYYDAFNLVGQDQQLSRIRSLFNLTALNPVFGSSNVSNLTTTTTNNGCGVLYSPGCNCSLSDLGPFKQTNTNFGAIWMLSDSKYSGTTYTMQWINDINKIHLTNGVDLTRGTGNCAYTATPSLTLDSVLSGGNIRTWVTNQCFRDNYDPLTITFKSDHTFSYTHDADNSVHWDIPISWSAPNNSFFFWHYYSYNYATGKNDILLTDTINVKSFTESLLNLDAAQLDIQNCNPAWIKQ
jgi:hypothetical protein